MDSFDESALKLKYNKSKLKVKLWESEFKKKTGNNPSKDDIKAAPDEIRAAYKWYWQIKIHSLGQELDATFAEKIVPEPVSAAVSSAEVPEHLDHVTDKELTSSGDTKQINPEAIEPKTSVEVNIPPTPVAAESLHSKVVEVVSLKDEAVTETSDPLPSSIWGTHLNNKSADDDVSVKKKSISRASSSFQLAEKLFVGAKFKKRNPRKSLSFSAGRLKERSLVSSDSLVASDSSFSLDCSQGVEDGFPVSDLERTIDSQNEFCLPDADFKMVKRNVTSGSIQSVSAIQRMMEVDSKSLKPRVERSVDKGWLERVTQADEILSQEVSENAQFEPVVEPVKYETNSNPTAALEDSDDDIIYGSDTESKSPRKVEREQKARLALRPTAFKEASSITAIENKTPQSDAMLRCDETEANPRKRKLDAIEAAMAVLSERRKNDKALFQASKKSKKSVQIQSETLDEDCDDPEVDENLKVTTDSKKSKPKMSKKELLEKKVASGSANDNFIRINMKKKVFVRGKKTMNFQKYKKQQWKTKKKELSDQASAYMSRMDPGDSAAGGGLQKCFKCGDVGHYARKCTQMKGDSLMPQGEDDEDESPFPSLAEVEKMAYEKSASVHNRTRHGNHQEPNSVNDGMMSTDDTLLLSMSVNQEHGIKGTGPQDKAVNCEEDVDDMSIMKQPANDSVKRFGSVEPLYNQNSDGSLIETPSEVYDALKKFGHQNFRHGQEAAIMRILSGQSTLVTLSTGSGKSLCYQLPAYLYATKRNCITLIVSPLVSLMDDQISGLPSFIHGAALHTGQTEKQREMVVEMAKAGKLHFLLVSPEAIVAGERKSGFGSLLRALPDIAFACIDEAHCVSQWSHNFRPSYLVIFKVLREKLGVQTVLGLTATATQTAVSSIIEHMEIPDGRNGVIQDTPLPNNLLLTVSKDSNRDQALIKLLVSEEFRDYKSIIVYCIRREECERLSALLRTNFTSTSNMPSGKTKVSAVCEAYHAGLSSTKRKQVQTAFMSGKVRIVVATVAFGMGINKSDIRSVVHFNMPSNFESYVQEVGRAGRDGLVSHCHLFLNNEGKDLNELRRHIFADSVDRHSIRKLLQKVFVPCKCSVNSGDCNEKSKLLEGIDLVSQTDADVTTKDEVKICKGHEVAFSIDECVAALDLPEENITTLLCYLELHDKKLLQVLPKAYTKCRIQSYKGMKHIREVARSCPPLAMAIAMDQMSGKSLKTSHQIEFPVVEIASAIGWDSGIVKRELMNLEWTKVNGSSRRSGLKVEFFDLGFRIRAPGNLAPEMLDASLDFLHERVMKQEKSALCQLQTIFSAVTGVSYPNLTTMMGSDKSDLELHSSDLKTIVRAYFQDEKSISENLKSEHKLENGEQIANDTRQLVNMYRDCSFTGRAVARIFHGISSPNFPALVWGRCRFWRVHLESDFKLICLLATQVLLKMR